MNRRDRRASRPAVAPALSPYSEVSCPDCAVPAIFGSVVHADSCPLLAALERVTAADAAWFQRNKDRRQRVRATTAAERTEQALVRPVDKPDRQVQLVRRSRGRYVRQFAPSGMTDLLVVSGE